MKEKEKGEVLAIKHSSEDEATPLVCGIFVFVFPFFRRVSELICIRGRALFSTSRMRKAADGPGSRAVLSLSLSLSWIQRLGG